VQLLEMAFVVFAEHPLNFFALQTTSLMSAAMDSLEVLSLLALLLQKYKY
jgi:hypothetical protein